MCGIAGIASSVSIEHMGWLRRGMDAIQHRGPDDSGEWWSDDKKVGFGFRRLAIIDLSAAGHQPMQNATGSLTIIFNGEIYNFHDLKKELALKGYSFHSASDTEVLLAAYGHWGTSCLEKIHGMFAFAIYDKDKQQVFIARDRAGEKPLFYYRDQESIYFASELKALMTNEALPRKLDIDSMNCLFSLGYVPGNRCILKGYNKLPPAHAATFDLQTGDFKQWRYWQIPEFKNVSVNTDELVHQLEQILENAVSKQLVADVPLGILLSGGVDSSLITAMASRSGKKIKTFTISFPGYGKYDETIHARLIADHFSTEHHELEAKATTVDLLPKLAAQYDEPIIDSSMIPTYLVSQMVREHCTVALGGDGGDELFGGYGSYTHLLALQQKTGFIPRPLRKMLAATAEALVPVGRRGRNYLMGADTEFDKLLPLRSPFFDITARKQLFSSNSFYSDKAEHLKRSLIPAATDLLQRATRNDFNNYLPEDILVKVDRASMLNSLEVRAPFLDVKLMEFAFGDVPSCLKATATSKKILLKKLCEKVLPPEFDKQRKQGFSIPLGAWLKQSSWQGVVRETLLNKEQDLFDKDFINNLLSNQQKGYSNSERIFALTQFELWRKTYNVTA